MTIRDQHILILGGSEGIGLAVARRCLAAQARVTITGRSAAKLESASADIADARLQAVVADVTDTEAMQAMVSRLRMPVDHVYVAAGAFVGGSLRELPVAAARPALDVRIWAVAEALRLVLPHMTGTGSITLTGGISTDRPVPGAWATAVATAAAEQMARVLALELAPLRVNAVSPGWTDTPMWDAILGANKAQVFAEVAARIPLRRLASADDVAQAVLLFITNPAITGEVIHVDGGHRLV